MFRTPDGIMISIFQLKENAVGYEDNLTQGKFYSFEKAKIGELDKGSEDEDKSLQEIKDLLNQIKF